MLIHQSIPYKDGLKELSRHEKWYLLGITLVGAIIRTVYLYNKPFIGDEVGTLILIKKDIPYLLSHFTTWLTMNYFIVLEKLIASLLGKSPFGLGFIPLAAGIVAIPLIALLAIRFTSHRTAMVAAALIAVNPYLIQYSGIIRSYSLLTTLSLLMIIVLIRWYDVPTYQRGLIVAIVCYVLILAHPNGAYSLAYLFFILGREFMVPSKRKISLKTLTTLLFPLSISLLMVMISYAKIFPEMSKFGVKLHDTPPDHYLLYSIYLHPVFFRGILRMVFGCVFHYWNICYLQI